MESPTSIRETLHAAAEGSDPTPPTDQTPTSTEKKEPVEAVWTPETPQEKKLVAQFEKELSKLAQEDRKALVKKLVSSDQKLEETLRASAGLRQFATQLMERFPELTVEELTDAMSAHRNRKKAPAAEKRGIDWLVENTKDPAIREELRESKRIMHEEMEGKIADAIEAAVKELRQEVRDLKSAGLSERSSVVESEIDALSDEEGLPEAFVERYRESIRTAAVRWRLPVMEVLPKVVPYADLKAALTAAKPASETQTRKPAPSPVSSTSASPDLSEFKKNGKVVGTLREMMKKLAKV